MTDDLLDDVERAVLFRWMEDMPDVAGTDGDTVPAEETCEVSLSASPRGLFRRFVDFWL